MIQLHPIPESSFACPACDQPLTAVDWYMPGMRMLAELHCSQCQRDFYGDLPAGHGLFYPMLLAQETGEITASQPAEWFETWLRESYRHRVSTEWDFCVQEFKPIKKPLLVNCLDRLYGHCLLKLLNTQYYLDHQPEMDVIVLIPEALAWLVPEGVAAVWSLARPLSQGIEWNDWLAAEIRRRLSPFDTVWLSLGFAHPHPDDFQIARFSRVVPFANAIGTSPLRSFR